MCPPADNKNVSKIESGTTVPASLSDTDRRRKRRAKMAQPVRVRPSEPGANDFDEVLATLDVCRNGIYFPTQRETYKQGMRLFVTFPFRGASEMNPEYIGQVVRIDRLPDGNLGVAVHLLQSIDLKTHGTQGRINYTNF